MTRLYGAQKNRKSCVNEKVENANKINIGIN
jgi:hypothetical protein